MKKLIEKLNDRYNILVFLLLLLFFILSFRLASLTIISGDELRRISNTKKIKEIPIMAPRGEIRDRYGRLLAGNKPSYIVQLIKDEIDTKSREDRNNIILSLVRILDEEGEIYNDEFPIIFNSYKYKDDSKYFETDELPRDRVIDSIIENNLIEELISTKKKYSNTLNVDEFITAKKAINILQNEGVEVPIHATQNGNTVEFIYDQRVNIDKWKKDNQLPQDADARSAIIKIINSRNARNIVMKIINDPIVSKLAYDILDNKGLVEDIKLEPMSLTYDTQYRETKRNLIKRFDKVTINSSAVDDFINILKETEGMSELLETTFSRQDRQNKGREITIIPGEIILEKFKQNQIEIPIELSVDEENNKVVYRYKSYQEKVQLLTNYKLSTDTSEVEAIIKIAQEEMTKEKTKRNRKENDTETMSILEDFIKDDQIKGIAQGILLNRYPNPRISIVEWEYTPLIEKQAWLNKYRIGEYEDVEEIFDRLKERTELSQNLTKYESRATLLILDEISKVGYRGYYPINIAYGINDKTVAKLEENKLDLTGVNVSLEPIRYYPNDKTAAHILGYMGRIAREDEIDKYVREKNYLPNTLIGKMGVEVTFEDYLKGKDGRRIVEADAYGNVVRVVEEEKAEPGNTLYLSIDSELQRVAEETLEKSLKAIRTGGTLESEWGNFNYNKAYPNAFSASAVAMDVRTGEVLALANYPSYDPNLFSTGISSEDWKSLNPEHDEYGLPLYNIAIQSPVQPGSTFKMITGIAGMESGISPKKKIYDYGYVRVGERDFSCLIWSRGRGSHGQVDIYNGLEKSCNYYFYAVSLGRVPKTGEILSKESVIDNILRVAREFGLDEKTGIEIPGERTIRVPDKESKVRSTKALLKRFLKSEIDNYIQEDIKLSEEEVEKAIEEIGSWTEHEIPLSKREVVNRLFELGINGEKRIPGRKDDLADYIKYSYLNLAGWSVADTLNTSIGQGQNAYTTLQMANYTAILSNGGYNHKVSIIDRVQTYDNTKKVYEPERESRRIDIKDYTYLEEAAKGMSLVTKSGGTARAAFAGFPVDVAGKTGTAERSGISPVTNQNYDNYAWFTAYAPYEDYNPEAAQIAVAVVIFQGGSGGYATPIAREIIAQYLGLNDSLEGNEFNFNNELSR